MSVPRSIAVIGGGPAGLMAAEVAAGAGVSVTVYDAMRSVGRKFLVAGKSGLNLTNAARFEDFTSRYSGHEMPCGFWKDCLSEFDSDAMRSWALGMGIETFVSSSGKIFPTVKKAAPLLRRWVVRLRELGVKFEMNHRWVGLQHGAPIQLSFEKQGQLVGQGHDAVVLALGGGSWPETGSNGRWVGILEKIGVAVQPLRSANCGWECEWTSVTRAQVEGQPLHNIHVRAGSVLEVGELMLTRYGVEGTLIYQLGRELRAMDAPAITIDFKPTFTADQLVRKMESARRNFLKEAQQRWKLAPAACAIIEQFYGIPESVELLATVVKNCLLPLTRPRPLAEAISTAGGVAWSELDETLMLKKLPGVYCAGEMLDWEAPTGGYLLQGCFATGNRAGNAAAKC